MSSRKSIVDGGRVTNQESRKDGSWGTCPVK